MLHRLTHDPRFRQAALSLSRSLFSLNQEVWWHRRSHRHEKHHQQQEEQSQTAEELLKKYLEENGFPEREPARKYPLAVRLLLSQAYRFLYLTLGPDHVAPVDRWLWTVDGGQPIPVGSEDL